MAALVPKLPPEDVFANTKRVRFIIDQLIDRKTRLGRPISILDFGCSNGRDVAQYAIRLGSNYVGVDIHEPSLDYARENYGAEHVRFLSSVPENEKYDAIILSEVLEHLDDPGKVLTRLANLLTDDGVVIGTTPNGYGLTELEKYLDGKLHLYQTIRWVVHLSRKLFRRNKLVLAPLPYNYESGHIQFFTVKALASLAKHAGLRIDKFQNGSVMGADLSSVTLFRIPGLIRLNVFLAAYLPHWAAATWHFRMERLRGI